MPPATELAVLFAPPPPQRRSRQLPAFIPNGPWSSPPPPPDNAQPRQPVNAVLPRDRSALWLRNAAIGLCALAVAAAAVSFTAQYRMVYADRRLAAVAGLEAAIPDTAAPILACPDAVRILEARAALLAERTQRIWEPTPDMPALVIIIDEYAELSDDAPDAIKHADSIARRGRAVAVNLVAATQRPQPSTTRPSLPAVSVHSKAQ